MPYPKISLAIDNCFAYKRWTRPADWLRVIEQLGVYCIEASADTEMDPLYMGEAYLEDWAAEVLEAQKNSRARVVNLYSGHGTYTTLGLTHTDVRARRRMIDDWFKPLIRLAGKLDAGIGFYAHAFDNSVMQDADRYAQYMEILYDGLCELSAYAAVHMPQHELGLEQMYTPHMVPWTLSGTVELLREVSRRSGRNFYITEDVGHHHIKFMRPTRDALSSAVAAGQKRGLWVGSERAFALLDEARAAGSLTDDLWSRIEADMQKNPHLFSEKQDGDCYAWLSRIGAYSPIIHLQQTDGLRSIHLPFTAEENARGIITGERVLRALKENYDAPAEPGMPARCEHLYLTLEVFTGTTAINHDVLADYAESVAYWRRFVPEDGLTLDQLV